MAADRQTAERQQQGIELAAALGPLLEQLADLLATRVANRLSSQLNEPPQPAAPARRLLTLEELVARLPAGKKPETWKRWLYQRTRHQQVPGGVKIGGRWFFDAQVTLPWLENGCTPAALDLPGQQSLHAQSMKPRSGGAG